MKNISSEVIKKTENTIAKIAAPTPLRKSFDYLIPKDACIIPGCRVLVPFGRRKLIGVVLEVTKNTDLELSKLKTIEKVIDDEPIFSEELLKLITWASKYYIHPIGEVIYTGVPASLKKDKTVKELIKSEDKLKSKKDSLQTSLSSNIILNDEQKSAIEKISNSLEKYNVFLLQGITGSGKTEVYLKIIEHIITEQTQVLFLVPEISLTPQTLSRLKERFGQDVYCYHSNMTDKQKINTWFKVKNGIAKIVIGTRSSIFLPFKNLKLIIVDEEHDAAYKQQEGFRYSARDLCVIRANFLSIPVILGSATPSLETILNTKSNKYTLITLNSRAGGAKKAKFTILDVRHKKLDGGLSAQLIKKIKSTLLAKQQVLLFINRRGYSPAYMCYECGWIANCNRCDAKLTLHLKKNILLCHHCNKTVKKPHTCPECSKENLNALGVGTQRIEEALAAIFPETEIVRFDSDSTSKKGSMEEKLKLVNNKEAQILIGTQMIAKGHHFPNLTLVAILDVDGGLFSADFKAVERMGQQILQVSGRAGREQEQGEVVLQSYHHDHPVINNLIFNSYGKFAADILTERKNLRLPPYSFLCLIRAQAKNENKLQFVLERLVANIFKYKDKNLDVMGPINAPMHKKSGNYRMQVMLKANSRSLLHKELHRVLQIFETDPEGKSIRWSLDLDPYDLI